MQALTTAEYDILYNKALLAFAELSEQELNGELYGLPKHCTAIDADLVWVYVYALNSYDPTSSTNHLTETQVLAIFRKLQNIGS